MKKLWAPLNTPDYTPYISQIADCDVVCAGLTGSNPLKFVKQVLKFTFRFEFGCRIIFSKINTGHVVVRINDIALAAEFFF